MEKRQDGIKKKGMKLGGCLGAKPLGARVCLLVTDHRKYLKSQVTDFALYTMELNLECG